MIVQIIGWFVIIFGVISFTEACRESYQDNMERADIYEFQMIGYLFVAAICFK